MSPKFARQILEDGSFIEISIFEIKLDRWRPHGVKYRLAWVKNEKVKVLFDNHHGKADHYHIDGDEFEYQFSTVKKLRLDFEKLVIKLGGVL